MAVVLLVGRHKDMAAAAAAVLEPGGHRCVAVLNSDWYEKWLADDGHDVVVLGPSLSPPQRDRAAAASSVARQDVPIIHVRTLDEAVGLPAAVNEALSPRAG